MNSKMEIDIRGLAKLITGIESRDPAALRQLAELSKNKLQVTNHESRVLGITGPPGAGKSTLVDHIIRDLRRAKRKVGVVAIDPSSPFSGGAVLGDRIRMQEHAADSGVFIRSVGSRGSHGGLSRATRDIVRAFIGYGFDYIIVETVGVGQTELDIMEIADCTVVVLVPESGDMIQTMKAGLLEIADIFVVNKADRPGAGQMQKWLTAMFDTGTGLDEEAIKHHGIETAPSPNPPPRGRRDREGVKVREIPVLTTEANRGNGIEELMNSIKTRLDFVSKDKGQKEHRRQLLRQEFFQICAEEFKTRLESLSESDKELKKLLSDISLDKISLYDGLKIIDKYLKFKHCGGGRT